MSISLLLTIFTKGKFLFAMFSFIVSVGILYAKKFKDNAILQAIISLIATLSTYFLADQIYAIYKDEINNSTPVVKEVTMSSSIANQKWSPKIYRGERSYSVSSKYTVKDNYTGLIWQKEDDGITRKWEDASKYCESLPLGGYKWRLPSMEELYYLGDVLKKTGKAYDSKYFDLTESLYWSSTDYKYKPSHTWTVSFEDGNDHWTDKNNKSYILCIKKF